MTTWLEDYKRRLDSIVSLKQQAVAKTGNNDLSNAYAVLANSSRGPINPATARAYANLATGLSGGGGGSRGFAAKNNSFASDLQKAYSTSFNAIKSGGTWLIDKLARPNYAVMNAIKESSQPGPNDENFFEALWKGFSGQEKTTGIDVINQRYPNQQPAALGLAISPFFAATTHFTNKNPGLRQANKAIEGLAGDVLLDPTTYVGVGAISKVGKLLGISKKAKHIGDFTEADIASRLAENEAKTGLTTERTADNLFQSIRRDFDKPAPTAELNKPFEPKLESTLEDAIRRQKELETISARARVQAAQEAIAAVPVRRYTSDIASKIRAPYNTKITPPKIEELGSPKKARKPRKGVLSSEEARSEAFYQYYISNPEARIPFPVKGGDTVEVSIRELRRMASEDPKRLPIIDAAIRDAAIKHAARGSEEPLYINLVTRSGNVGGAISHENFIKLLTTGELPKNKGPRFFQRPGHQHTEELANIGRTGSKANDAKLATFAFHDAEDLNNFYVSGLSDEIEPVGDFLSRLGVTVRKVDPEKVETDFKGLGGALDNPPGFPGEEGSSKTFSALTKKQKEEWIKDHKDLLDEQDIETLLSTRITNKSDAGYIDALANKVLNRKQTGVVASIDELMDLIAKGQIDPDDLKKLMQLTGAKTVEGMKKGLEQIFKALDDASAGLKKATDELAESGKLWETLSPVNALPPPVNVKPASEILHDIIVKGDDSAVVSMKESLDVTQVRDLNKVLNYLVKEQILDPMDAEKYGFVTKRGVKKNSPKYGEGDARNLREWDKFKQYDTFRETISEASGEVGAALKASGVKNVRAARQAAIFDHVMPILRTTDKILVENGIPPTLTTGKDYTLGLVDVLDAFPREFVEKHLFDLLTSKGKILHENIPPTLWNDAASFVLDYSRGLITEKAARQAIKDTLTHHVKTTYKNKDLFVGTAVQYNRIKKSKGVAEAEKYADSLADEFMSKAQVLAQAVETKAATLAATDANGAKAISEATLSQFAAKVADPNSVTTDILELANDTDKIVDAAAESVGVSSDTAKTIAKSDIMVQTASIIPPEVMGEAKGAKAMARVMAQKSESKVHVFVAPPNAKVIRVVEKQMENAAEAAAPFVDDIPVESLNDIFRDVESTFIWKILHNFAPHLKNRDIRPIYLGMASGTQTNAKAFARKFGKIAKTYTNDEVMAGFKTLQAGEVSPNQRVQEAAREINQALSTMFRDDEYDLFSRHGITPQQVNQKLARYGIPEKFALKNKESWKAWEFEGDEHPMDILSKFQAAVHASILERQLGAKLTADFGSRTPKAGYVRIKNDNAILSHYLHPDAYFPREIAEQFSVLNNLMKELNAPTTSPGILNIYDAVLHSYKSGLTIYRPGHHVRNMIGDIWFSWMDGVNDPQTYTKALYVMKDNWHRYDDWDPLQALAAAGEVNPSQIRMVVTTKIKGRRVELNTGEVWRAARERGLLTDYGTLEDIGTVATQNMWKPHLPGKFQGKLHNLASATSETRDHYIRLAHFIDRLEKSDGDSLAHIFDAAAQRVRKWHPDGTDLTQFERKFMRRAFLFYSWQRKAIPLVLEAITHKPGKVLAYNKAMYALAEANGIDPNSFGDPFPDDQLFPDWLRDEVTGPQFQIDDNYWGINPGVPSSDILNDYFNSPGQTARTVLGSLPMGAKQAIELTTGVGGPETANDLRTGVPQYDASDYIDAQLPGINYLAKLTGRSPSSGFTQRVRESNNMTPEELEKARSKFTTADQFTGLFNWITGLSATNMSKPGTIKSAQFDQKEAIKKALKDATR